MVERALSMREAAGSIPASSMFCASQLESMASRALHQDHWQARTAGRGKSAEFHTPTGIRREQMTYPNRILPAGLEPAAFRLLAECSNQLSYESWEGFRCA